MPQAVVTHFGEASSKQASEAMYLQLYRSKVQFYRKFGGETRANRFKRLLRLAYLPRLATATIAASLSPRLARRAQIYYRLLTELSSW